MAVKKLILDDFFEEEEFSLIGIHCTIEDYRLAFQLNKSLNIKLKREDKDIDNFKLKTNYPIFEWEDDEQFKTWSLVSNSCKVLYKQQNDNIESLFNFTETSIKTHHLVSEYSKANFLLKINNELDLKREKLILDKILNIDQVITAYSIDVTNLKSKDQLIFN